MGMIAAARLSSHELEAGLFLSRLIWTMYANRGLLAATREWHQRYSMKQMQNMQFKGLTHMLMLICGLVDCMPMQSGTNTK